MEYNITIYKNDRTNAERYVLGIKGLNPLVVIGLNPSTADDSKPDRTISKVMGIAKGANKDGFIMINLYPQRATYPSDMDIEFDEKKHENNIRNIKLTFEELGLSNFDVLLGFGDNIRRRDYLFNCLRDIVDVLEKYSPKWNKTGEISKCGNPKHPLYIGYWHGITPFDLKGYLSQRSIEKK